MYSASSAEAQTVKYTDETLVALRIYLTIPGGRVRQTSAHVHLSKRMTPKYCQTSSISTGGIVKPSQH